MSLDQTLVTISGLAAIIATLWYFFSKRERTAAHTDETGVQEMTIGVKGGYSPDTIVVKRGKPVRLLFRREEESSCSDRVVFGDFGISSSLPAFKTTPVEFTPNKTGKFMFTCGMGMLHGTLIVEDEAPERKTAKGHEHHRPSPVAGATATLVAVGFLLASFGTVGAHYREVDDGFVHPFLAHMALADPVGEVSFRFTGIHRKDGPGTAGGDYAVHIEAGLLPRLGLHIRNDAIKDEPYSEAMLMYNAFVTQSRNFGVSVFGQVSMPTGREAANTYKGLFGIGLKEALPPFAVFNGDIHYDPKDRRAEYEGAFVFRASPLIYPVFEARGEITKENTSLYLLPGLKFLIREKTTLGVGYQLAVTQAREYDNEALLQFGVEF